jgi:outer membrane protein TolC
VAVDARQWWKVLADLALDGLVDQAVAGNLDLQQATCACRPFGSSLARRTRVSCRKSPPAPSRCRTPPLSIPTSMPALKRSGTWACSAPPSAQLSAQASAGNAEALRNAAQVAVIADVVRSYLDLTVAQAQQDLLARQQAVDDRGEQLALVRQRLRLDEPGELDRLRARQAATRAATAQARENADNAARALALLLGRDGPDPAWRAYRTPPTLGTFSLQQVPADLLRHRPQILLAESEVMQAAASKGSARAAMYPRVSLGGSILYAYNLTQNAAPIPIPVRRSARTSIFRCGIGASAARVSMPMRSSWMPRCSATARRCWKA